MPLRLWRPVSTPNCASPIWAPASAGPRAPVRAVRHHEIAGRGDRPRPGHRPHDRGRGRRSDRGLQRGRGRHDLPHPAARRGRVGTADCVTSGRASGDTGAHRPLVLGWCHARPAPERNDETRGLGVPEPRGDVVDGECSAGEHFLGEPSGSPRRSARRKLVPSSLSRRRSVRSLVASIRDTLATLCGACVSRS